MFVLSAVAVKSKDFCRPDLMVIKHLKDAAEDNVLFFSLLYFFPEKRMITSIFHKKLMTKD